MARLSIALLGSPEVRHGGQVIKVTTRKTMALLAYLVVEGGLHSRETLTAMLWPDTDEAHGRTVLRTTLHFLRAAVGHDASGTTREHLARHRDTLAFDAESDHELDVYLLRDAARLARARYDTTPIHLVPRLQAAVDRYRGDFLAGFNLEDAPDFDSWASTQREGWHRRATLVLDALSRWRSESGAVEEALESAGR